MAYSRLISILGFWMGKEEDLYIFSRSNDTTFVEYLSIELASFLESHFQIDSDYPRTIVSLPTCTRENANECGGDVTEKREKRVRELSLSVR